MINKTQFVVQTDKTVIEWLESQGYNYHNLPNNYTFPVFRRGFAEQNLWRH